MNEKKLREDWIKGKGVGGGYVEERGRGVRRKIK